VGVASEIGDVGEGCGAAIVGEARRNGDAGAADFLIGIVHVLIGDVGEEFIFEDGSAERAACGVAMQGRNFFAVGNVAVGFVEIGSGVEPVGAAMDVGFAVKIVGAGGGAHVDVSAAGGTLLGVVHGGVDAKFLNGLRSGGGQSLADGEIHGTGTLDRRSGGAGKAGGAADAGVIDDAGRSDGAGAFAVEEIAGVDAVEEKRVAGVALAVGPDRLIAEAVVDAGAAGEFGVDAGRQNGEAGEAAGGKWSGFDLRLFEDVAVGGVDGVEKGSGFDGDGGAGLADLQGDVDGGGAIGLHEDGGKILRLKAVVGEGEGVRADGEIDEIVAAGGAGFLCAGELGGVGDEGDEGVGDRGAGRIGDGAGDAAEGLLREGARVRVSVACEAEQEAAEESEGEEREGKERSGRFTGGLVHSAMPPKNSKQARECLSAGESRSSGNFL
jgi:hypothetical protein